LTTAQRLARYGHVPVWRHGAADDAADDDAEQRVDDEHAPTTAPITTVPTTVTPKVTAMNTTLTGLPPVRGFDYHLYHAVLMLLAWWVMTSASAFFARYLKDVGDYWGVVHLVLGVLTVLLTFAGFALAIVGVNGGELIATDPHHYLGYALMFLVLVQPAIGVYAQRKFDPARASVPIWPDGVHNVFGYVVWLGFAVQTYLGVLRRSASVFGDGDPIPQLVALSFIVVFVVVVFVAAQVLAGRSVLDESRAFAAQVNAKATGSAPERPRGVLCGMLALLVVVTLLGTAGVVATFSTDVSHWRAAVGAVRRRARRVRHRYRPADFLCIQATQGAAGGDAARHTNDRGRAGAVHPGADRSRPVGQLWQRRRDSAAALRRSRKTTLCRRTAHSHRKPTGPAATTDRPATLRTAAAMWAATILCRRTPSAATTTVSTTTTTPAICSRSRIRRRRLRQSLRSTSQPCTTRARTRRCRRTRSAHHPAPTTDRSRRFSSSRRCDRHSRSFTRSSIRRRVCQACRRQLRPTRQSRRIQCRRHRPCPACDRPHGLRAVCRRHSPRYRRRSPACRRQRWAMPSTLTGT
jgi:hypothetical protein